jgi:DNA-binding SARP family transcriptional activator/DNA-binding beta-propeller fold protein YncE
MEFRVLGRLEVVVDDVPVALGGSKQRTLLAHLLLNANAVVSADQLVDVLWGEEPPATATHTLHVYVSQLRKLLKDGDDVELATEGRGYALRLPPEALDLTRFLRRSEAGRRALTSGNLEVAATELREALAMWRGDPLSDLPYDGLPAHEMARLHELRLGALEDRVEADLGLGRDADLIGELGALVASNPLRERVRGQQVIALYRSGRQAEALQSLRAFRQMLGTELGIDPGHDLQRLEVQILQQDPELDWHPAPAATRPSEPDLSAAQVASARRRRTLVWALVGGLVVVVAVIGLALVPRGSEQPAPTVIDPNAVGRIDPATAKLEVSIPTAGAAPGQMAWADGSLWVANTNSGTVARIDPASDRVIRSVSTDGAPTDLAAGEGAVWVLNGLEGEVRAIDPRTNEVTATVSVPQGSGGIAVGAGFVWVANTIDTTVTKINPATATVVGVPIRLGPRGTGRPKAIAVGDGTLWVGDELEPGMWEIQASTGAVVGELPVGLRDAPSSIIVADNGAVWVSGYEEDVVSVVDPSSLQVTTYEVGRGPTDLAAGAGSIWVVESLDGTVASLNPLMGAVVARKRVGGNPQGVAVGGGSVWVSRPA